MARVNFLITNSIIFPDKWWKEEAPKCSHQHTIHSIGPLRSQHLCRSTSRSTHWDVRTSKLYFRRTLSLERVLSSGTFGIRVAHRVHNFRCNHIFAQWTPFYLHRNFSLSSTWTCHFGSIDLNIQAMIMIRLIIIIVQVRRYTQRLQSSPFSMYRRTMYTDIIGTTAVKCHQCPSH